MSSGKALAIVEFNSFGRGLANAQEIMKGKEIEVLEMITTCGGLTLILSGGSALLTETFKQLPHEDRDHMAVIENFDQSVLRALYSLENAPVQGNLLVLEGEFAGDLVEQAQRAVDAKIAIVDLKIPRGAARAGYLLLTHRDEKTLTAFRSGIGDGLSKVTLIREVVDDFKRYFDLGT